MKEDVAKNLIDKTKEDYNTIATDFSNKRSYLSSDIIALKAYLDNNDKKVLDLGCGNGRASELFPDGVNYVGVDTSAELIKIAKERYPERNFMILEGLDLPFPDNHFDIIYCLAVLHHVPGKNYRLKFLEEAKRVLKPGGKLVLTVWNLWAKPGTGQAVAKYALLNLGKFDLKDILYPFKDSKGRAKVLRYIHCFTERELTGLVLKSGFHLLEKRIDTRDNKKTNENILVVGQKP